MSNNVTVGLQGKAYILTTGTRASWGTAVGNLYSGSAPGSLSEINCIADATLNADVGEADASNRSSLAKLTALVLDEVSIDLKIPWNAADANFLLLRNARVNRTPVAVALLDGADTVPGSFGYWADWVVTKFVREEPLTGTMIANVTLKPTPSAVPPQWVVVA
jgi:hypothetical protein